MGEIKIDEDANVIGYFLEDLQESYPTIEQLVIELEKNCSNQDVRAQLLVKMHALMQRAVSCEFGPAVEPFEILMRVLTLGANSPYLAAFAQTSLLVMDRLVSITKQAVKQRTIDMASFGILQSAITPLARVQDEAGWENAIKEATDRLLGNFSVADDTLEDVELFFDESPYVVEKAIPAITEPLPPPNTPPATANRASTTPNVFRILGTLIDTRHQYWKGRTDYIIPMALGMNALAGNPVDMQQLVAAVNLHDTGMLSLSDDTLYAKKLTDQQWAAIKGHPVTSYELALGLDEGRNLWSECARIVYQHHERPDGKGYPEGLTASAICDGAKILAICDAFYAMTHAQAHQENRRSILRAVAEINACAGSQFDAAWVQHFNTVVKTERAAGGI